jgi:hypothetical protein
MSTSPTDEGEDSWNVVVDLSPSTIQDKVGDINLLTHPLLFPSFHSHI